MLQKGKYYDAYDSGNFIVRAVYVSKEYCNKLFGDGCKAKKEINKKS